MMGALHQDRVKRSVLFMLVFLSGAAALIYQTSWHRLLGLFAGADTIAAALVVGPAYWFASWLAPNAAPLTRSPPTRMCRITGGDWQHAADGIDP